MGLEILTDKKPQEVEKFFRNKGFSEEYPLIKDGISAIVNEASEYSRKLWESAKTYIKYSCIKTTPDEYKTVLESMKNELGKLMILNSGKTIPIEEYSF